MTGVTLYQRLYLFVEGVISFRYPSVPYIGGIMRV